MSAVVPTERQRQLLAVVHQGAGEWDARYIDLTMGRRHRPTELTILQELQILEQAGLVASDVTGHGVGGRWAVTAAALPYLPNQAHT